MNELTQINFNNIDETLKYIELNKTKIKDTINDFYQIINETTTDEVFQGGISDNLRLSTEQSKKQIENYLNTLNELQSKLEQSKNNELEKKSKIEKISTNYIN